MYWFKIALLVVWTWSLIANLSGLRLDVTDRKPSSNFVLGLGAVLSSLFLMGVWLWL